MNWASEPLPKEVEISSNVDLIVRLRPVEEDGETFTFYVTAWSLQQASPVLSRIIQPDARFKQSSKEDYIGKECAVIYLEDDHPKSLAIVFYLLHLNSSRLPDQQSLPWLYLQEIATIWDKYDISLLFHIPWLEYYKDFIYDVSYEDWLFIAKVFRKNNGYAELTAKLAVEIWKADNTDDKDEWTRCAKRIYLSLWPDFVKDHVIAERARLLKSLNTLINNWKDGFGGARPRAKCSCYGQQSRYSRHTMLSNDIASLLSRPISAPSSRARDFYDTVDTYWRRDQPHDIMGWGRWEWEWSIADLRHRISKVRSHLNYRDMRQVRYMLQNPDVYDLCGLEESAMRVLLEFDDIISTVRGIDISGKVVEFPIATILKEAGEDPWNTAVQYGWRNWSILGLSVTMVTFSTVAILLAILLGTSAL